MARLRLLLTGGLCAFPTLAWADSADWKLPQWQSFIGDAELDVAASAGGALFTTDQPRQPAASGDLKLMPRLHRDYDSGLSIGLDAVLTASDALSRGRYGGDAFEKAYAEMRTGLGRLELGQTDGAAYDLAVTGPKVDEAVSLDNPQTSFLRDPGTGHAFIDTFRLSTAIGASSNYAKLAYVSPNVFGVQLALSFSPGEGKNVLPFLNAGPQRPGRAAAIWEASLRYATDLGPVSLTGYAGLAEGRAEHKLAGQQGLSDIGLGLRADYPINDDVTFSLGGAWRQSSAHAFDINQSWQAGKTEATHISASISDGALIAGLEYGNGLADKVTGLPRLGLNGYQASLGYALNSGLEISGGWQQLAYGRSAGLFFNGAPRIRMEARFLHLNWKTTP
jgi:predicted porin